MIYAEGKWWIFMKILSLIVFPTFVLLFTFSNIPLSWATPNFKQLESISEVRVFFKFGHNSGLIRKNFKKSGEHLDVENTLLTAVQDLLTKQASTQKIIVSHQSKKDYQEEPKELNRLDLEFTLTVNQNKKSNDDLILASLSYKIFYYDANGQRLPLDAYDASFPFIYDSQTIFENLDVAVHTLLFFLPKAFGCLGLIDPEKRKVCFALLNNHPWGLEAHDPSGSAIFFE